MENEARKRGISGKFFLLFWLVMILFFTVYGISNGMVLREIENTKEDIKVEINEYQEKIAELGRSKNYFDSDAYIEKIARERLGLVKPDEILYYKDSK